MSGNLLEMVQGHLGEASVSKIGSLLGQSSGTTHAAIGKALPVLLGGLVQKGSTREGSEEISRHLDHVDDRILDDVPGFLSSNTTEVMRSGTGMLSGIFGGNLGGTMSSLSPLSGLGEAGTGTLLKVLAPIVLATLARYRRREGLDAAGLQRFLESQRPIIEKSLPAGFGERFGFVKKAAVGAGAVGAGAAAVGQRVYQKEPYKEREVVTERQTEKSSLKWVVPALGIAALGALGYGLLKNRHHDEKVGVVGPEVQAEQGYREPDYKGPTEEELGLNAPPPPPPAPPPMEEPKPPPETSEGAVGAVVGEEETVVEEEDKDKAAEPCPKPEVKKAEKKSAPVAPVGGEVGAERGMALEDDEGTVLEEDETTIEETPSGAIEETETDTTLIMPREPLYLGTLFESGESTLSIDDEDSMQALLQLINDNPGKNVEIRGYSFGADTPRTHLLAQERADAVKAWLGEQGVDEGRITTSDGGPSSRSQIDVFFR